MATKELTVTELRKAVMALDPANDVHWTPDGWPNLGVVSGKAKADVTRAELDHHCAGMHRSSIEATHEAGNNKKNKDGMLNAEQVAICMFRDPGVMLDAVVAFANTDRFRRNNHLRTVVQAWQNEKDGFNAWQKRLDERLVFRKNQELSDLEREKTRKKKTAPAEPEAA